jgi:phytoene dehydrogenase-like protein
MAPRRGSYDVVVVGGGHNGLVAAAYLACAGRSCLLLERRERLGGAAVSQQAFAGVPARLSRYSYLVSLLPRRIVDELGLRVGLRRRCVSSYTPDPRVDAERGLLVDERNPSATAASFRALAGGERELRAWERFYATTRSVAERVFPTMLEPLRSREQMRRLLDDEAAWRALFERPIGEAIGAAFADEVVAGVVLTDALIGTFASAAREDLVQNRCFLYHVIGDCTGEWRVPVGGMGAVTDALAQAARAACAELLTGAEVLAIVPGAAGTDAEVRFIDGDRERSVGAGAVLVNAAPHELERLLAGHKEAAPRPAPEGAQLKVNMLLSRLPRLREQGLASETAFAGTFHVNESATQLQRAYEQAGQGRIPSPVPCETYCHSLADPSILDADLRNAGVHTMTVFALQMPARLFRAAPERARDEALAATLASLDSVLAEPIADCLLRGPSGEPCIEAHSPLDLERELRMPGGHIFHRDLQWPFAESEHEVGTWGVETSQPGIYLCGAGARRGGGVSGIPGRNAAMAVMGRGGARSS